MERLLKRYWYDEQGNFSMMFSVSFLAMMLTIGSAIDIALITKNQSQLQNIADSAVLAATLYNGTDEEKKQVFDEYITKSVDLSKYRGALTYKDVIIDSDGVTLTLNARVEAEYRPLIMQVFTDFDSIKTVSTAKMGINDVEVALVLDISSSMAGGRIAEAKRSTQIFIDEILDDEKVNQRVSVSFIPFGGTVRVPENMNFLLETPAEGLDAYSENWIDNKWNQCFEFDTANIEDGIDLIDGKYKVTPDYWSWNKSNPWCPRAGSEMIPLTDDKQKLFDQIDTLTLSDGTGSDHGMLWGYETLNSDWKNKFPDGLKNTPADDSRKTNKVIVFMTDGGITGQHYVRDSDMLGEPPYNSKRKNRINTNTSLNTFYKLCDKAKSENIEIFTIGYTITRNNHINPLKACASGPENYINAASGNLDAVFSAVATAISPLRISD